VGAQSQRRTKGESEVGQPGADPRVLVLRGEGNDPEKRKPRDYGEKIRGGETAIGEEKSSRCLLP